MGLDYLVSECSEILESEFGIKPESSTYRFYSNEEWLDFLARTNSDEESLGVYLPRSLSAHLKEDSEFLPVNLIHEYFGHGLFCEYSSIGRKIVALEQQLAETEKKVLGLEQLPERGHFTVDETNPRFQEYKTQREQLAEFLSQNIRYYEGFAMWMEGYLAHSTGNGALVDRKMNEVVHPVYKELFEQFKSFEEQYGGVALMSKLGIPCVS